MSDPLKLDAINGGGNGGPATPVSDATDIESLWLDPALGDGIVDVSLHSVPVGKPRDFFRTVIDRAYRQRAEIYTHKPEGVIEETTYVIAPAMRGRIEEARPCTLVTVVYRDGAPRLGRSSTRRTARRTTTLGRPRGRPPGWEWTGGSSSSG
jgi:hypothetical protein